MKKLNRMLAIATAAIALFACANPLLAQQGGPGGGGQGGPGGRGNRQGGFGGGNFDPAQMQQRMMERFKETLEITDDNEWKAIEPLVQKVNDARMAAQSGMGRGMMGMGGRNRGGDNADQGNQRRGGFGQPNPDAEALQKAIDAKASGAELKAALQKYVESRKVKQAALEKAQADLRKVLTPRQEAIATMNGLL